MAVPGDVKNVSPERKTSALKQPITCSGNGISTRVEPVTP
ncbi:hypothetical protein KPSA1_06133 [Pseudomonas syringae pv. actinidiae]|uniref:Uncharacterized protein n=1 Tax=Pseudomonas syringae pv. actinidiae TaxID=103796 RepID=A0A2V0QTT5_PSESF|nr:hypothetical protein KPSA1_06133 [Pseudomonas syringae pv. actinidiae]